MTELPQNDLWHELQTRFDSLKDAYQRLDSQADQHITRWRYALDSAFELSADHFRRSNTIPAALVDDELVNAPMFYAYGYDSQDRVVYSAVFQMEPDPRVSSFYEYQPDGTIELVEYGHELYTTHYHLVKVARLVHPLGEKPLRYAAQTQQEGRAIQFLETYHYDAQGRLARVTSTQHSVPRPWSNKAQQGWNKAMDQQRTLARMLGTEDKLPQFEELVGNMLNHQVHIESEEIYEYKGDVLKRIVSRSSDAAPGSQPRERIIYEAPRAGETSESRFEAARLSLRAAVLDHIHQFDPHKREQTVYYNLVLSYDAVADEALSIELGTEMQRQAWEKETDEYSYESLVFHLLDWTYQSGGVPLQHHIVISVLPRDYERFLENSRREKAWDLVRDLLNRVARDLNDQNWEGILRTTDDFIVYASDYEALDPVNDEIVACVPRPKLKILRDKGLLPEA